MPIISEEWLVLAETDVNAPVATEAQLRRAVSTAYYALFHLVLRTAAQNFAGPFINSVYLWVYRRIEHRRIWDVCKILDADTIAAPWSERLGFDKPSDDIRAFASGFRALQEGRHEADYNPATLQDPDESRTLVATARDAMAAFARIPEDRQNAILLNILMGSR